MDVGENVVYHFQHFFFYLPRHEKSATKTTTCCPRPNTSPLFLISSSSSSFPLPMARGKGFVVSLRNKELLREVGRRDFELGSDPVFPAEREEMVLGRMVYNV